LLSIYEDCLVLLLIVLDYRLSLLIVGLKSFFDDLNVIIDPAACFASVEQSFSHAGFSTLQDNNEGNDNIGVHVKVPSSEVLKIPRKAVDQKFALYPADSPHLSLQQLDSNLTRHDTALNHAFFYQLLMLTARVVSLGSQQISSRHVVEAKFLLNELALCAFSGARTAQDEHYSWFLMTGDFRGQLHHIIFIVWKLCAG
jgi:hypothetical protein